VIFKICQIMNFFHTVQKMSEIQANEVLIGNIIGTTANIKLVS